ncbi:uncharacterized protein METZ01_LOCUS353043, partial [marine metagenome]
MFEVGNKGWWYKSNLFDKHEWNGQVLYLDLDTVVMGSLDKFF